MHNMMQSYGPVGLVWVKRHDRSKNVKLRDRRHARRFVRAMLRAMVR